LSDATKDGTQRRRAIEQ